jgi:hypothetical protein
VLQRSVELAADYLASAATSQRKLTNDVHDCGVFILLGRVAEHLT